MSPPPTDSEAVWLLEPAWDIARLFPPQGAWSETDYLALDTHRLVELSDGRVEVLPVPTDRHQAIVAFLFEAIVTCARAVGGTARFAPLRLRIAAGRFREPDLLYVGSEHGALRGNAFWRGADLVMEVVSADDPDRDRVTKRAEYAAAGIAEYWIIDPIEESILVLGLDDESPTGDPSSRRSYIERARSGRGEVASSTLLADLEIEVDSALDAD